MLAWEVLRAVDERGAYANILLPALLAERSLAARDRAFATELAYGSLRAQGMLDGVLGTVTSRPVASVDAGLRDALRLGTYQLLSTRVPARAAVATTVELVRATSGEGPVRFANAVLRRVASRIAETGGDLATLVGAPPFAHDPLGHLAAVTAHPRWVVDGFADRPAVGHVVAANQDDRDVGLDFEGAFDLGVEGAGLGTDDREAAYGHRAPQLLGQPGGEQGTRGVAGDVGAIPGRGRVAEHREGDRLTGMLGAVPAVAAGRRRLGERDDAPGEHGLADDQTGEREANRGDAAGPEHARGGYPAYLARRLAHRSSRSRWSNDRSPPPVPAPGTLWLLGEKLPKARARLMSALCRLYVSRTGPGRPGSARS